MEITAAILLVAVTVLIHGFGTFGLIAWLVKRWKVRLRKASLVQVQFVLTRVVVVLFILSVIEAGVWALFFWQSGAMTPLDTAFYFSVSSYSTVGYGDVVLPDNWRILGAFESCVGVLMLGWSSGIIIALVGQQFTQRLRSEAKKESGTVA